MTSIEVAPADRTGWRSLPPLALVPIAAVLWWVVGFLPWLLNGPGREVLEANGVGFLALPPLSSGSVSQLVLGAGFGGVLAGLAAVFGAGSRALRAAACSAGVVLAFLVTLVQTRNGGSAAFDSRIAGGLTLVVVGTAIAGLGLGLLSLTGRIGLGLAIGTAAGAVPIWVMSVFNAFEVDSTADGVQVAHRVSEWSGAVVLAVALVCVGVLPAIRAAAWIGVVLVAWFIGPTITAAAYMEVFLRPGMGLPDMWGDQLSATWDVWQMAASLDARSLTPWIVPIVVAAVVAAWLARRPAAPPVP